MSTKNLVAMTMFLNSSAPPSRQGLKTCNLKQILLAARMAKLSLKLLADYSPGCQNWTPLIEDARREAVVVRRMAPWCIFVVLWGRITGNTSAAAQCLATHYGSMAGSLLTIMIGEHYEFAGSFADSLYSS